METEVLERQTEVSPNLTAKDLKEQTHTLLNNVSPYCAGHVASWPWLQELSGAKEAIDEWPAKEKQG